MEIEILSLIDERLNRVRGHGHERRRTVLAVLQAGIADRSLLDPPEVERIQDLLANRIAVEYARWKGKTRRIAQTMDAYGGAWFRSEAELRGSFGRLARRLAATVGQRSNAVRGGTGEGLLIRVHGAPLLRRLNTETTKDEYSAEEVGWILRYYNLSVPLRVGNRRVHGIRFTQLGRLHDALVRHSSHDYLGLDDWRRYLVGLPRESPKNVVMRLTDPVSLRLAAEKRPRRMAPGRTHGSQA